MQIGYSLTQIPDLIFHFVEYLKKYFAKIGGNKVTIMKVPQTEVSASSVIQIGAGSTRVRPQGPKL